MPRNSGARPAASTTGSISARDRARADRERHALRRVPHRVAGVLVHRRAVGDRRPVARDALGDHGVDVGVVAAEPRAHDLGVGEPGELVEVLLGRERLAVLGEEIG